MAFLPLVRRGEGGAPRRSDVGSRWICHAPGRGPGHIFVSLQVAKSGGQYRKACGRDDEDRGPDQGDPPHPIEGRAARIQAWRGRHGHCDRPFVRDGCSRKACGLSLGRMVAGHFRAWCIQMKRRADQTLAQRPRWTALADSVRWAFSFHEVGSGCFSATGQRCAIDSRAVDLRGRVSPRVQRDAVGRRRWTSSIDTTR